ncbi:MAG: InlB B-repeat-containing protein, partial [Eubacterium sp.]
PLFTADTVLDGDVTLHALWKVRKYDVAFDYPDYYTKDNPLNIKVVKDVEYGKTMDAAYPLEDPEVGFLDEEKNVIFTGWSTMKPDNLPKDDQNNTIAQSVNVRESTTIDTSETGLAYYEHYGYFKDEKEDEKTVITLYPVLKTYSEDILYYKNDGSKQNEGKGDILKTVTAIYDNCFTKPEDPKRDGYTFLGWSKTQKADYQSPEHEPFVTEYSETEKYLGEGMSFF